MAEMFGSETKALELSPLQQKICAVPERYSLFLGGGRGGAKSHAMAFIALQHATQYGERARILYIRQTYKSLADFEEITRNLFYGIYGKAARYNHTEGVWRLPNGAYFEIGQMEGPESWPKYVGRSFTLIMVDELTQFATPELLDRLNSNLRGPAGIPLRVVYAGNPGEIGHQWCAQRYVFRATPWVPFVESVTGREWVYVPSTYLDNPFIDREAYRRQLESSCPADPELLEAWLSGNWAINRGSFFALVLSEERNCVNPWPCPPNLTPERTYFGDGVWLQGCIDDWKFFVVFDWGLDDPGYCGLFARSPGAKGPDKKWYPKGSVILIDEICSNVPGQLNIGQRWTIDVWAAAMKRMWAKWGLKGSPRGYCDRAIFNGTGSSSNLTLADELRAEHISLWEVPKNRDAGWERLRVMMAAAGGNEKPAFYAARNATYFWSTAPFIGRSPRNQGDLNTDGPDHACDVCRYACVAVHGLRQRNFDGTPSVAALPMGFRP